MDDPWPRTYIKDQWPPDMSEEHMNRRIVESLIMLHRMRKDRINLDFPYFVLPNPKVPGEVLIGFTRNATNGIEEGYLNASGARPVDVDLLAVAARVVNA